MSSIHIEGDAMRAIVAKAVLEGISQDQRDLLVEQAIQYIITAPPKPSTYGAVQQPSPLQAAFQNAIQLSLSETARRVVDSEPVRQRVDQLMADALADVMKTDNSSLPDAVRAALGQAISTYSSRDF